jgi:hypothetical protein
VGAAEELVPLGVYYCVQAVAGLAYGRTKARETEPVRPIPDLYIAIVLPFVRPVVAAMLKVQRRAVCGQANSSLCGRAMLILQATSGSTSRLTARLVGGGVAKIFRLDRKPSGSWSPS